MQRKVRVEKRVGRCAGSCKILQKSKSSEDDEARQNEKSIILLYSRSSHSQARTFTKHCLGKWKMTNIEIDCIKDSVLCVSNNDEIEIRDREEGVHSARNSYCILVQG